MWQSTRKRQLRSSNGACSFRCCGDTSIRDACPKTKMLQAQKNAFELCCYQQTQYNTGKPHVYILRDTRCIPGNSLKYARVFCSSEMLKDSLKQLVGPRTAFPSPSPWHTVRTKGNSSHRIAAWWLQRSPFMQEAETRRLAVRTEKELSQIIARTMDFSTR